MHVEMNGIGEYPQVADAGLLDRLAQRGLLHRGITRFAVTAELEPSPHPWVEGQQHRASVGRQHQRACREMTGGTGSLGGVGAGGEESEVRLPEGRLCGIRR